jgi:hypothetical protein
MNSNISNKEQLFDKSDILLLITDLDSHIKYANPVFCNIADSFPMTTAHFKRANKSNNFKGEARYGFCASKSETYYGFKGHLLIDDTGNIANFTLTEASGSEREAVWECHNMIDP